MLLKKIIIILVLFLLALLFFFLSPISAQEREEEGQLSIFFMGEKVGYEEYVLESDDQGFVLEASGRITKPVVLIMNKLIIRLNKDYIPRSFYFQGSVSGVNQEIQSSITDGNVKGLIKVSGQETNIETKVKRDSFLLPSGIFSPYVLLTKKFRCNLQELVELSAYIIPQMEVSFTLEPKEGSPCFLVMNMGGIVVEIETNGQGNLKTLLVPSQRLRVIQKQ